MANEVKVIIVPCSGVRDIAARLAGEKELFIVHDENVAPFAARVVEEAGSVRGVIALDTSEALKTMDTVTLIARQLMEADASRGAFVLAIGGGITSDLAGFAAAIYKRGIRWAAVPTTLLSQVDAAIGGKTGANLDGYKNMIGAFHMPEATFILPSVLETLPPREFRAGLAEMLKTFLLADAAAFDAALREVTPELVLRAALIKADIVNGDPFEKGERAKLNLGHSFGHAIEHCAMEKGDDIIHGEAVAMGTVLAARLSDAIGLSDGSLESTLREGFASVGLPTNCPYPIEELERALRLDKKAASGRLKFILLEAPGKPLIKEMTIEEAMDDLRKHSK